MSLCSILPNKSHNKHVTDKENLPLCKQSLFCKLTTSFCLHHLLFPLLQQPDTLLTQSSRPTQDSEPWSSIPPTTHQLNCDNSMGAQIWSAANNKPHTLACFAVHENISDFLMFDNDSANTYNLELHPNWIMSLNAQLGLQPTQDKAQSFTHSITGHSYNLACYTCFNIHLNNSDSSSI